jgi:hypothetical protein
LFTSLDGKKYCPLSASNSNYLSISSVRLGDSVNNSGAANYSNFSARIIQAVRGQTLRLVVKEQQIHPRLKGTWHVFLDWHRNGVLDDTGEVLVKNVTAPGDEISVNVVIPDNAQPGLTRLRITDDIAGGNDNPCINIQYGEVEDHILNIK